MKAKIINNNKGLTLIETMVAIMVFGIVLIGLLDICTQCITMGKRSELSYRAYNLAKNRIETLKTQSFGNLSSGAETDTILDENGIPDDAGVFKRNTTVATSYNSDSHLTSVLVTVDYKVKNTYSGKPTRLSTVVFEYA